MPALSSPTTLYRIDECADLMADACIRDEQGNLIFISVWARYLSAWFALPFLASVSLLALNACQRTATASNVFSDD